LGAEQRLASDDERRCARDADRLPLGGDFFELLVGLGRIHVLFELLRIESELLAEADQRVVVELALRAVLAAVEQSIVVVPVLILLAGGEQARAARSDSSPKTARSRISM